MTDRYTLAEARAIIDAERCVRNQWWCDTHECYWSKGSIHCRMRPEVADVAAQLLATVERVEKRVRYMSDDADHPLEAWHRAELLAAINGEEVTE